MLSNKDVVFFIDCYWYTSKYNEQEHVFPFFSFGSKVYLWGKTIFLNKEIRLSWFILLNCTGVTNVDLDLNQVIFQKFSQQDTHKWVDIVSTFTGVGSGIDINHFICVT